MAYHIDELDENAIVIDGWEQGMAEDPYEGIANIHSCNLISAPKEACVNFATTGLTPYPLVDIAISSADPVTNIVTFASTPNLTTGQAVTLSGASLPTGLSATRSVTDGVTTNGDATLTSATANFVAADVGCLIACTNNYDNASGIPAGTTIASINSTTSIEMSVPATASKTGLGLTFKTYYWLSKIGNTTGKFYTDWEGNNVVTITGTGTGTFTSVVMGAPQQFDTTSNYSQDFAVDAQGQVWQRTRSVGTLFRFMGNIPNSFSSGNGLVFYQGGSSNYGFLFVFSSNVIDYYNFSNSTWYYDWNPTTGVNKGYAFLPNVPYYMKFNFVLINTTSDVSHEAIVGPDAKVYYCDGAYIGRFYQTDPAVAFSPINTATYTQDQTKLLPFSDNAQCITFLGNNLLIGGIKNVIYPWDTFNTTPEYPIFLAEGGIYKMITINTNVYALVGSRGRIYITNGTNAKLYKKIPDYITGYIEPVFVWGGLATNRNQLYFGFWSTKNGGGVGYAVGGGVWAIDIDTEALRMANDVTGGASSAVSYVTAMMPILSISPTSAVAGSGLLMGWDNTYAGITDADAGIDVSSGTPYTAGSKAYIETDMIPIGTYYRPKVFKTVEYKLSKPLVTGESISIYFRTDLSQSFSSTVAGKSGLIWTSSTAGVFSDNHPVNFSNCQWIQLKIVLTSTATNPSYVRLKEVRIK